MIFGNSINKHWRIALYLHHLNDNTQTNFRYMLTPTIRYCTGKYRMLSTWHFVIGFLAWEVGLAISNYHDVQYTEY